MSVRLLRCKNKPATISGSVFPGAGCSTLRVIHQQQPSSRPGLRCAKSHPRKHPGFGALQNCSPSSALEFSESDETCVGVELCWACKAIAIGRTCSPVCLHHCWGTKGACELTQDVYFPALDCCRRLFLWSDLLCVHWHNCVGKKEGTLRWEPGIGTSSWDGNFAHWRKLTQQQFLSFLHSTALGRSDSTNLWVFA